MKVKIEFTNTDVDGEITTSLVSAMMEIREHDYRLLYAEDLSGDGKLTKSTLTISDEGMRIIRNGELTTDFMYADNMVHNTNYQTPYGNFPVTLTTLEYSYSEQGTITNRLQLPEDFAIHVYTAYSLKIANEDALTLKMNIKITPI